jgi:hypothetical protein
MKHLAFQIGLSIGILAGMGAGAPAWAHHSGGMFDRDKPLTLEGTVKEFQWTNPHAGIWIIRKSEAGGPPDLWNVELTSPGNLTRQGWTKRTFQPGDHVIVVVSPLRSGGHAGSFRKATLDNGQVLTSSLLANDRAGIE